jgi:hypothetical protein
MADRPQVPNWNNINLNKPDEYSSEFTVDGNRYANVTNVTTGQRQLYLVSGIGGTPLTQRTLLTSTTSDGKVTNGEGYDDFIRVYGKGKLNNAQINNKKQSEFIISKASTAQEKQTLGQTKQYNGSANKETQGEAETQSGLQSKVKDSEFTRKEYPGKTTPLVYPIDRNPKQDYIKFTMVKYSTRSFNGSASTLESGDIFGNRSASQILGCVTLPIQPNISDTNLVQWGESRMNAIEAKLGMVSLKFMEDGDAGEAAGSVAKTGTENAGAFKALAGAKLAEAAVGNEGGNLFTRLTGGIVNPNLELLFQGPQLRSFTFNFTLSAREPKEAQVIKQIIRFFKQGMSTKRSESGLFLKSPNTFKVSYIYGESGKDHPWINRVKECALQNFTVNYTPGGSYATFEDGAMTQYDLTLSFGELDPIYDDDYKKLDENSDAEVGY